MRAPHQEAPPMAALSLAHSNLAETPAAPPLPPDPLRDALLDSRQRWRDFVTLATDFAFETDHLGRLSFVIPDPALGWPAGTLIGQPANLLIAEPVGFDPFHVTAPRRGGRTWIRRGDGGTSCLTFSVAPLVDAQGRIVGVRGVGIDMTAQDAKEAQVAAALGAAARC